MSRQKKDRPKHALISHSRRRRRASSQKLSFKVLLKRISQHPILPFVSFFLFFMGTFYVITNRIPFYKNVFFPLYLNLNAQISAEILGGFYHNIAVRDSIIWSPEFSISIKEGCDAIEPSVLFIAVVLAFPAPFLRKIPGVIIGTLFLLFINLLRIISLFFIGVYYPSMFHFAHFDAWPAIFILLAVVLWALWIQWALQKQWSQNAFS